MDDSLQKGFKQLLIRLDRIIEKKGKDKVKLYLVGAGAMSLAGIKGVRNTNDLDCFFEDNVLLSEELYEELDDGRIITLDRISRDINFLHPDFSERAKEIMPGEFLNITVMVMDIYDMALMKMGRFHQRDQEDLKILFKERKIEPDYLKRLFLEAKEYYVGNISFLDTSFKLAMNMLGNYSCVRCQ